MIRILLTLIFISIPVFAVDSIYTWGYGEDIRNILISIKFFTGNATYLIDTAVVIGMLMVVYKETQEDNVQKIGKVLFLAIFVSQMFFHSTKDYMIEDEVTSQAFSVTNIPVGIGELFSIFTNLERVITHSFEESFSTPNSLNFSQVGLGFSMNAHLSTNNAMFIDGNAHETFMEYTTNCIVSGMLDGQIDKNIIASDDIVGDIRVEGFETIVYKSDGSHVQLSCQDSYDNYIKKSFENESNDYITHRLSSQLRLEPEIIKKGLYDTSEMFFGISKSGTEYVKQQMGKNMLKKGIQVMAMTTGGDTQALAYGSAVSSATMENQWQQSGIMAQTTLPMIKAYLTSVILAMTPMLALLSIMFGDWKHIKMIITLLLTLTLFSPLATIINYLMYLKLEDTIPIMSQGLWMPMLSMRDINTQVYSYLNFLGYAVMSIPLLAYSLIKASEMGFVNFMNGMGGSVSGAANAGAGQKVNGVNIGNTKVGGGSHTGDNGITTDMGAGARQIEKLHTGYDGGVFQSKELNTSDGGNSASFSNDTGNFSSRNGKLSGANLNSLDTSIANGITASKSEAYAHEASTQQSMNRTLSTGDSQTLATGNILTDGNTLSSHTGLDTSSSNSVVKSTNESYMKDLNSRWNDAHSLQEKQDLAAFIGMSTGSPDLLKSISGFKVGADGKISASAGEGKDISFSMSSGETKNYQEALADNIQKAYSENQGVSLQHARGVVDNEVYSDTSLKSDMDAYSKAHSVAEKLSNTFGRTENETKSFNTKNTLPLIEKFIENSEDGALKGKYEHGGISMMNAVNEASTRINDAIMHPDKHHFDYNNLIESYKDLTGGYDISTNAFTMVDNKLDSGNRIVSQANKTIDDGKTNLEKTKIDNSITDNTKEQFDSKRDSFTSGAKSNLQGFKDDNDLNNKNTIDKNQTNLENEFHNRQNESKAINVVSGIATTGAGDVKSIISEIPNVNKNTSWNEDIPRTNRNEDIKYDSSVTVDDTQKAYNKAQDSGFIKDEFGSDGINNMSKMNDFSTKELQSLTQFDGNGTNGLNDNAKNTIEQEIISRQQNNTQTTDLPRTNRNEDIKYNSSVTVDDTQKAYNKTQDSGFIKDEFGSDGINNMSKMNDFSTKELQSLTQFNDNGTNGLNDNAKNSIEQEIISRQQNNTQTTDLSEVKAQLSYLKDEIEDSQYEAPKPINVKR